MRTAVPRDVSCAGAGRARCTSLGGGEEDAYPEMLTTCPVGLPAVDVPGMIDQLDT